MLSMGRLLLWSVLGWIAVIPCAIANGAVREFVLAPRWGMAVAQPLSGVLLALAIAAVVTLMVGRIGPRPRAAWLAVGAGWLLATLAFEFAMGLAAGRSWEHMLAPYRFHQGDLWVLVLAWIVVAPWLLARWRGLVTPGDPRRPPPAAREIGQEAERRACRHLAWRGWRIVARNWIGGGGELDIVASRWRTLLVVEVRRRPLTAEAFASIDRAKLDRTLAAAQALIARFELQRYRLRLDLIGIDAAGRLVRRRDVLREGRPGA